jgi:flagellar hook-associated protein 1 FlgK
MTIPTFMGLNTALSGLEASQAAIDTTGQNITNANTPGYSEEVVNPTTDGAIALTGLTGDGQAVDIGTGVEVGSITRERSQFLDIQYRAQNTQTSNASTVSSELQNVQTALDEPSSDGISAQLSSFWQAWGTLADNPTSPAAEQTVVDDGESLAQTFNSVSSQIATVQSQAGQQYTTLTGAGGQVAQDADQIATLNGQIANAQAAGQTPNTLLDQRDSLLDDLSGLAQISITNQTDGSVTVNFGDASSPLVSGTSVNWPQTLTSASGGRLGALLSLSSATGQIGTLSSALDSVANQVITSVNALQPTAPFFSGDSAATIAVSATPSTIQTSTSASSGPDLAQSIAALQNGTADQDYAAFVGQVGDSVQSAQTTQSTAQAVLTAISNQRQSVSGVSLDQEMTNLTQFQQSYQASARMMNTMESVIDTLISTVGGAGL